MIRKKKTNLRIGYANFMVELMAAAPSEWAEEEKKNGKINEMNFGTKLADTFHFPFASPQLHCEREMMCFRAPN